MQIPLIKTDIPQVDIYQHRIKSILDPLLAKQIVQGILLQNVAVVAGANTIPHKLGRKMLGWEVVDIDANVSYYRTQPLNDETLTLTFGGAATITLWVF